VISAAESAVKAGSDGLPVHSKQRTEVPGATFSKLS